MSNYAAIVHHAILPKLNAQAASAVRATLKKSMAENGLTDDDLGTEAEVQTLIDPNLVHTVRLDEQMDGESDEYGEDFDDDQELEDEDLDSESDSDMVFVGAENEEEFVEVDSADLDTLALDQEEEPDSGELPPLPEGVDDEEFVVDDDDDPALAGLSPDASVTSAKLAAAAAELDQIVLKDLPPKVRQAVRIIRAQVDPRRASTLNTVIVEFRGQKNGETKTIAKIGPLAAGPVTKSVQSALAKAADALREEMPKYSVVTAEIAGS